MTPLGNERLIVVSGKGGVGKTTLASALAWRFAASGRKTLLVSMDAGPGGPGRTGLDEPHPVFGVPLTYDPQVVEGDLSVCRLDAFEAVREYARRRMPFGAMYDAFFNSRMFRDFAAAAPGFEELMSLGKLLDLATATSFRTVVFDAPATGHARLMLGVPEVTARTVLVGPLYHSALRIRDLLTDPARTRILVVALAEEMALAEARELAAACRDELEMPVGPVVVNRCWPDRFSDAEIQALMALTDPPPVLKVAIEAARSEHRRAAAQVRAIDGFPLPVVRLPRIVEPERDAVRLPARLAAHLDPLFQKVRAP